MNIQRNPRTPYIKAVRPMTKADLESLRQPSARVRLQSLKDSHHIMARLIVSGLSVSEIAAETGYSVARVCTLKGSPAMKELVARYRADAHDSWKRSNDQTYESILAAEAKAWRKINDLLDADDNNDTPEIPLRDLMKVADSGSDRTGHHRKSTKENVNINFAANLEAAIVRSRSVRYIDVENDQ